MRRLYDNILQTIGHTPVVRINKMAPPNVHLFAKIESFNPAGSIKDRIARSIIAEAEASGQLRPGQTVVEATSGNTGISLAMVCAQKGYPLVVVMAENFSVERRRLMRFFGAKVILTPAAEKGSGMFRKASELAIRHDWFLCNQFENKANAHAHVETTAVEILDAFAGQPLDYIVLGAGTGGTVKGIAGVIKMQRPETRIVLCEPANSPLIQLHHANPGAGTGPANSSPAFRPHPIQGWSPDFVPTFAASAAQAGHIDEMISIEGAEAIAMAREAARKEGIFCGISAGATLAGALEICRKSAPGSTILCLLPDTGERYQSTPLFDGIETEMNEEEIGILNSVTSVPGLTPAPSLGSEVQEPSLAENFVRGTISDTSSKVVIFGLQWCEFTWSLRKFLDAHGIAHKTLELDSAAFMASRDPGDVRTALKRLTGTPTIPQLFVAGHHVGGCTDVFDAWREGRLQSMLRDAAVIFSESGPDPESHLPNWTAKRQKTPSIAAAGGPDYR
ncbi:MAG TPA: pyridoxal-phosphate dependent enzyme [Aestuariivirga sp.]